MSRDTVIFFLIICIIVLSLVVIFQHITFRRGIQEKLKQITLNLSPSLHWFRLADLSRTQ